MEILDANLNTKKPPIRGFTRLLTYCLYSGILSFSVLWNATGVATKFRLPYDFGHPGGCFIELPLLFSFGIMGILLSLFLLGAPKNLFWCLVQTFIIVFIAALLSWLATTNYFLWQSNARLGFRFIFPYEQHADIYLSAFHCVFYIIQLELLLRFKYPQ